MMSITKVFLGLHKLLFRVSKGSFGGKMWGINILILNTVGRKSGQPWSVPLGYLVNDGHYVVAAFAGGAPKHPTWYYNLKQSPDVVIEVPDGQTINVHAEEAAGETRDYLWNRFKETVSESEDTYDRVTRTIPIIILHPQSE